MSHAYSTDSAERRHIPLFIAASAIGATFLVFHFLETLSIEVPWWIGPPIDTMAFYGFFYYLFDQHVWKWRLIHRAGITKIPNLTGEWRGEVVPTETPGVSAGLATTASITLSIRQTWTRLRISGETNLSKSSSISASFVVTDERSLSYEYVNEPGAAAPATMHIHRGMARLTLDHTGAILEGEYYSGRDRQNVGTIRVARSNA